MPFFCKWCILILAWWAGGPLMMTHLRVVARKQNCVSAPVSVDLVSSLSSVWFGVFSFFRPQKTSRLATSIIILVFLFPSCIWSTRLSSHIWCTHTLGGWTNWLVRLAERRSDCVHLFEQLMDCLVVETSSLPVPQVLYLLICPHMWPVTHSVFLSHSHLCLSSN